MADAAKQVDIVRPVIAPAAAAFHRPDLRETRFPEAQDVLRHVEVLGYFADGTECVGRLVQSRLLPYRSGRNTLSAAAAITFAIDALLENSRRLEHHRPPRRNRHFLPGFRIAADALPLLAHDE